MITREEIEKLATLARIEVNDAEKESLRNDIESILEYVKSVNGLHSDEGGIEGTPILRNVMREDMVTYKPGEFTEDLLSLAPYREGNYVKVKKIL